MRQLVIHGHFYQPPREDPWLGLTPRELSAAPDHDWNERITRQCYEPLTQAPVLDSSGSVTALVNAFEWCSFDIGPTLFAWIDRHAPSVRDAIIAGDRAAAARTGHGNAIAMPYHHTILPLMSRRDRIVNIRWGMRDFERRFGRVSHGIWLPETAVDHETLDVLAQERIPFTILAPQQVQQAPPFGRAGRWRGPSGEVAVFVYDGPSSHAIAFGGALDDATAWEAQLTSFPRASDGPTVVSVATDGETFGHHHHFGDLALATLIHRVARRDDARLTNFAALLAASAPRDDIELVSPSSWSCPHGVERWRAACGCHHEHGTSQAWRAPLRHGLESLAAGIESAVERLWPGDRAALWHQHDVAGPDLATCTLDDVASRSLLEVLTHRIAMFTSCAWFFDDVGRLEPRIVLAHAARALELLPPQDREQLEQMLVATLSTAQSNDHIKGNGADIWYRDVLPGAGGPAELVAALGALRNLSPDSLADVKMPLHDWSVDGDALMLRHLPTGGTSTWQVDAPVDGIVATHPAARPTEGTARVIDAGSWPAPIRDVTKALATPIVLDAALSAVQRAALADGLLEPAAARAAAFAGALALLARDSLDAAVVMHGVLDLIALSSEHVTARQQAAAFTVLATLRSGSARERLAERLMLALPGGPA